MDNDLATDNNVADVAKDIAVDLGKTVATTIIGTVAGLAMLALAATVVTKVHARRVAKETATTEEPPTVIV